MKKDRYQKCPKRDFGHWRVRSELRPIKGWLFQWASIPWALIIYLSLSQWWLQECNRASPFRVIGNWAHFQL